MIGIGGFGQVHLTSLRTLHHDGQCRLVAVADPMADRFPETVAALGWEGVAVYKNHEALLARDDVDAVVIATPIWLHARQTIAALAAGKHVYLEKPPCATIQEYLAIEDAHRKSGKICTVGFQMQSAPVFAYVSELARSGELGDLTRIWAGIRWARDDSYYNRAAWSGKMQLDGAAVFDGPATNALAHEVHAALALAGPPARVRGRLMHARPIPSFDTSYIEVETRPGVNVRLIFTHASAAHDEAYLRLRGTRGQATFTWDFKAHVALNSGVEKHLSFPYQGMIKSMLDFLSAVRGDREPVTPLCATLPFLQAVHGALQSSKGVASIAPELVSTIKAGTPQRLYTVTGLDDGILRFTADPEQLPSAFEPGNWLPVEDLFTGLYGSD